jgi:hypothetical protein
MSRRQLSRESSTRVLNEADLDPVRVLLPRARDSRRMLGAFSAIGHVNNPQLIVARQKVNETATERLQTHLEAWLKRTNATRLPMAAAHVSVRCSDRRDRTAGPTFSAHVNVSSVEGLSSPSRSNVRPISRRSAR